jgi:hypothetical protein
MRVWGYAIIASITLSWAGAGWAQSAAAPPAGFAVPVEALKLGGAKAGFMESGSAAGGRQILVKTSQSGSQVFGKTKTKITNAFRYMTTEGAVTLAGKCVIRTEGRTMLGIDFSKTDARGYSCSIDDQAPERYALEVALPAFAETRLGGLMGITISKDRPAYENQAILRGRLIYAGVAYDAKPTGFSPDNMMTQRVVQGYDIFRDGKLIGRLAYRQKGITSVKDQGDIIIPTAQTDDRDAVLFMIMSLNAMPDVYAELVRRQIGWN